MLMTTTAMRARRSSSKNGSGASIHPSSISATLMAPEGSSAREMSSRLTNCGMATGMINSVRQVFFAFTSLLLMTTASNSPKM